MFDQHPEPPHVNPITEWFAQTLISAARDAFVCGITEDEIKREIIAHVQPREDIVPLLDGYIKAAWNRHVEACKFWFESGHEAPWNPNGIDLRRQIGYAPSPEAIANRKRSRRRRREDGEETTWT